MMDLFFCHVRGDPVRDAMAVLCQNRWDREAIDRAAYLTPQDLKCINAEFQLLRRVTAEVMSKTDFYIVADSDCLPQAKPFVEYAEKLMEIYDSFAMLSLMPSNCTINPWTPETYTAHLDSRVMEHHSVGGIRICRKGVMGSKWPKADGCTYDAEHCEEIRRLGYRVGYFRNITQNHLGEGYSQVWKTQPEALVVQ